MPEQTNSRELILNQGQFAYIKDTTKGTVQTHVGPKNIKLEMADQPVRWDEKRKQFVHCAPSEAICNFVTAPEGFYVQLLNPHADGKYPRPGEKEDGGEHLQVGHKVNIKGPVSFALFPGQEARVIRGHTLRVNEYLVTEVYNAQQAQASIADTVAEPQNKFTPISDAEYDALSAEEKAKRNTEYEAQRSRSSSCKFAVGQRIIIRGDIYSFYIPPTGIKVVKDPTTGHFVRDAVSLERLEYAVLVDENGNKRFEKGPQVVFPLPTEIFEINPDNSTRKFSAIELNANSGIHIIITSDYDEYKEGDELFITGDQTRIYYPRPEHAIVDYDGKHKVQFATVVPEGEGQYVLDKETGKIELVRGPKMLLPDPRRYVIVNRVLSEEECNLWFPGNSEALLHNRKLAAEAAKRGEEFIRKMALDNTQFSNSRSSHRHEVDSAVYAASAMDNAAIGGDSIKRSNTYTKPRAISIDRKYDGAVSISVYPNYAVQIMGKSGERQVVKGPANILLEYGQRLVPMALSSGTPKTGKTRTKTSYLQLRNNFVTDEVPVVTKDEVEIVVRLRYLVNFEGDKDAWFNIDDYVGLLADYMRSLVRGVVRNYDFEEFFSNHVQIIRDSILGQKGPEVDGKRPMRNFVENGMQIAEVEVHHITVNNSEVYEALCNAKHALIVNKLGADEKEQNLELTKRINVIETDLARIREARHELELELQAASAAKKHEEALKEKDRTATLIAMEETLLRAKIALEKDVNTVKLEMKKSTDEQELAKRTVEQKLKLDELEAKTKAVVDQQNAITPDLIAALTTAANAGLAGDLAKAIGPMANLNGMDLNANLKALLTTAGPLTDTVSAVLKSLTKQS